MFHSDLGLTLVPTFCRDTINPLAASTWKASRKVGRETLKRCNKALSLGKREPGGWTPAMISLPSAAASESLALRRAGADRPPRTDWPGKEAAEIGAPLRRPDFDEEGDFCAANRFSASLKRPPDERRRFHDRALRGHEEEQQSADDDFRPPTRLARDQVRDRAPENAAKQTALAAFYVKRMDPITLKGWIQIPRLDWRFAACASLRT